MKAYLNDNLFYQNLEQIPVENYVQYRKYLTVYGILGANEYDLLYHELLLEAQEFLKDEVKIKIVKKNIHVLKVLISRNENYSFHALFCLLKGNQDFEAGSLKAKEEKLLKGWKDKGVKEPYFILNEYINKLSFKIQSQIVEKGFEDKSQLVNGYWKSKEEEKKFNLTRDLLVSAMKKGSYDNYYKLLNRINTIEDATEIEMSLPVSLNKTIGVLKQKTEIKTAFDFYIQKQLLLEEIERRQDQGQKEKKPDEVTSLARFKK